MNTLTISPADLRSLDDDDLAILYREVDEYLCDAILTELDRRDRTPARPPRDSGWAEWAHGQYLLASKHCGGAGLFTSAAPGRLDSIAGWRGPITWVLPYATTELKEFWLDHPRLTPTQFTCEMSRAARLEREAAKVGCCILCGYRFRAEQLRQTCRVQPACERRQASR